MDIIYRWPAVLSALLLLSGCNSLPFSQGPAKSPDLAPASLPEYIPGEYFVFNNETVHTVSEREKELVVWKTNTGLTKTALTNFLIPDLAWQSKSRSSKGSTTAPHNALWPLKTGNRASVPFQQTITKSDDSAPTEITRNWKCEVEGTERTSIQAGTFDTYRISCLRNSPSSGRFRARKTYYYAPSVGHYILVEEQHKYRGNKRKELSAYGFNTTYLSSRDERDLKRLLQKTLDKNPDGKAGSWTSRNGLVTAMLVPVSSYRSPTGQSCRKYRSIYSVGGRIGHKHERNLCKDRNKGLWVALLSQ
ncbi:MAG: hypothetical protein ABW116_00170 [Candidatus Sedimenticola sp. 20ELBAFRAG]